MKRPVITELILLIALSLGGIHSAIADEKPNPELFDVDGRAISNIPPGSTYVGCQDKKSCTIGNDYRITSQSTCSVDQTVVISNEKISSGCPEDPSGAI